MFGQSQNFLGNDRKILGQQKIFGAQKNLLLLQDKVSKFRKKITVCGEDFI